MALASPPGAPALMFFNDSDELARFGVRVLKTYRAALDVAQKGEMAAAAAGSYAQAVLFMRLVVRMLKYNADRAATMLNDESIADLDKEMGVIWPAFQGVIDDELSQAKDIMDQLQGALNGKAN